MVGLLVETMLGLAATGLLNILCLKSKQHSQQRQFQKQHIRNQHRNTPKQMAITISMVKSKNIFS